MLNCAFCPTLNYAFKISVNSKTAGSHLYTIFVKKIVNLNAIKPKLN